jgi:hypothetical protein
VTTFDISTGAQLCCIYGHDGDVKAVCLRNARYDWGMLLVHIHQMIFLRCVCLCRIASGGFDGCVRVIDVRPADPGFAPEAPAAAGRAAGDCFMQ